VFGQISTQINSHFTAAAAIKQDFSRQMAVARSTLMKQGQDNYNAQIAVETARASAEVSTQSAIVASISTRAKSDVTSAVSAESSRADDACDAMLDGKGQIIPSRAGTTTDHAACSSADYGKVYFSQGNHTLFLCSGISKTWNAYIMGSFAESQILNDAQRSNLATKMGPRWVLCYSSLHDGFTSFGWHALCNWRGATVSIGRATNGRVYGGYSDVAWGSRNTYTPAHTAFTFRFSPYDGSTVETTRLSSDLHGNSLYDHQTYPPTWGGGHDLYMGGNCQSSAYASPSTYVKDCATDNYSNTFMTGSTSWTNSAVEVYYMV
jgi:hypothetical protein